MSKVQKIQNITKKPDSGNYRAKKRRCVASFLPQREYSKHLLNYQYKGVIRCTKLN